MRKTNMILSVQAAALILACGAQAAPASAPTPKIDNPRVSIWDVNLDKGQSGPVTPDDKDAVIMFLEGGKIQTTDAKGKTHTVTRKFGDAVFVPKGTDVYDTVLDGGPAHEVVVVLKDAPSPVYPNTQKLPLAFPRPGSVKVLTNKRVTVWHYSWMKDKPTPLHFHDTDVVVAYRYDGAVKSTTQDGVATVNNFKKGEIRFNLGNRTHTELLDGDKQSAVMVEIK